MVYTEDGMYTAVRRRAPHHCTRSPPEAMTLPNRGVLSAASCITETESVYCAVRAKYLSQFIISQLHYKDVPALSIDQGGHPRAGKQTKIRPRAPRGTKEYDCLTDGPSNVTSLRLIP